MFLAGPSACRCVPDRRRSTTGRPSTSSFSITRVGPDPPIGDFLCHIRYDTICYFNVQSTANTNLPHGTSN